MWQSLNPCGPLPSHVIWTEKTGCFNLWTTNFYLWSFNRLGFATWWTMMLFTSPLKYNAHVAMNTKRTQVRLLLFFNPFHILLVHGTKSAQFICWDMFVYSCWYFLYVYSVCIKCFYMNKGLIGRVFTNGPGDQGSIPSQVIPKTQKIVLDTSLLNTQHYKVHKWSNTGKRVAPYPTLQCSS